MEMQSAQNETGTAKYGVEAGYSEDYGAAAPALTVPVEADDQGYGTMNTGQAEDGQPKNPFTQQQYDTQKSSNPFK